MAIASAILSLVAVAAAYTPKNDFAVTVTVYRGMKPLWTYCLSGDSISVTRHYAEGRREATALKRDLTVKEMKRLDRYFAAFPLAGLQRRYTDERYDGDSCLRYLVKINRGEKESYVCYARPAELAGLNRAINRLLPRQYRLWLEE
jgi:hypothetical protein